MTERKMVYLDDVIKLIKAWDYSGEMYEELKELPSAQPEHLVKESSNLVKDLVNDCISRQDAMDALAKFVPYVIDDVSTESYTNGLTDAYNLICQLPSAQPERKKGRWIKNSTHINCSVCKHCSWSLTFEDTVRSFNYCPECGADMRGDNNV